MNWFLFGNGIGTDKVVEEFSFASRAFAAAGSGGGIGGECGAVGGVALKMVEGYDGHLHGLCVIVEGGGIERGRFGG